MRGVCVYGGGGVREKQSDEIGGGGGRHVWGEAIGGINSEREG